MQIRIWNINGVANDLDFSSFRCTWNNLTDCSNPFSRAYIKFIFSLKYVFSSDERTKLADRDFTRIDEETEQSV